MVMLNLPDRVFVNNHQRFVYEYLLHESLRNYIIPYVHHLEKIEEIKFAAKIGSLEVTPKDMEMGKLKDIKIPVNEFIFRERETLDLIFNKPLKFDKTLLSNLTSLYFVEIPLAWIALGTSALSTICKNLKEYRIFFKKVGDISMGLFDHIQKIQSSIKCTNLELNYKAHETPTISKSFMKLIYKEGSQMKIIHTSRTDIQLSDSQEEIIHHTPDYIILSNLDNCQLADVRVTDEDEDKLFSGVSKYKIHLKHSCFIILNGFFDRVSINNYESMLAVNPYGCDVLDLRMEEEYKGFRWLKFCNFFKKVSVFTKLSFTIEMQEKPFSNLFHVLKEISEMEVISFGFIISHDVRSTLKSRSKEKVRDWILGLPKLRTYTDSDVTIRNVDQYDGKKKLEQYLNETILQSFDVDA